MDMMLDLVFCDQVILLGNSAINMRTMTIGKRTFSLRFLRLLSSIPPCTLELNFVVLDLNSNCKALVPVISDL